MSRQIVKRLTMARRCDTSGCAGVACFLAKLGPGRAAGRDGVRRTARVQLCDACAVAAGHVSVNR